MSILVLFLFSKEEGFILAPIFRFLCMGLWSAGFITFRPMTSRVSWGKSRIIWGKEYHGVSASKQRAFGWKEFTRLPGGLQRVRARARREGDRKRKETGQGRLERGEKEAGGNRREGRRERKGNRGEVKVEKACIPGLLPSSNFVPSGTLTYWMVPLTFSVSLFPQFAATHAKCLWKQPQNHTQKWALLIS